jgi:transposase-like protein
MSAKRLTHEERAEIYRLWKEEGLTYRTIAERCGVNPATVGNVVKKMNGTPGKSQINEEFDNAVNQMIEESKPQEIVQADKPVTMTEEHTSAVPDAVMQAVADKIETLSAVLSDNLLTIKEMQQNNEQIRSELAVLYGWRAEHEDAEN